MPKVSEQVYTRPPWERMMRIHQRIKSGHHPNCVVLAREIEVSTRTIKRDVDFMKYRLNLPIEYDNRRYGYYYTAPVEQFPSMPVTEAEIFALLVAHKAISQYHGTPFQRPLETAFRKLTSQLGSQADFSLGGLDHALSFRPFAPGDTDLEAFQVLTRALKEHQEIRFGYRNLGAEKARMRQVRPYHLACIDNLWYLFAYDPSRQAMRTFVLTRMNRLELTSRHFEPPTDFDPDEYLRGSFSVYKGNDDFEVVVDFDAWASDLIRGRQWHASQEITELSGRQMRMRMRLNNIEEAERWVLSWGMHATVVRPQALANRLEKIAAELQRRYATPADLFQQGSDRDIPGTHMAPLASQAPPKPRQKYLL